MQAGVSSVYTADELAQAIGVSQRTFYSYLSQGLLPEGRRVGRQVLYSTLHLHYGLLIRALIDGGNGLEAVRKVLSRLSPTQVQRMAAPLVSIVDARGHLEEELASATRQMRPADAELDFWDMRLEDPVALQVQIGVWENELQSLSRRLDSAFAQVREQVLVDTDSNPAHALADGSLEISGLRADVRDLTVTLRDLGLILAARISDDPMVGAAARAAAERLRAATEMGGGVP